MAPSAPRRSVVKTPAKSVAKKSVNTPAKSRIAPTAIKKAPIKAKKAAMKPVVAKPVVAKPVTVKRAAKANQPNAVISSKALPVEKVKKAKLVRDSFTMPEIEYAALSEVKKACLKAGFEIKKSELLRIGVALVRKLSLAVVKQELGALAPLKPGRPRKDKTA